MKPIRVAFSIVPDCHAATGHYRTLWRRHFYEGLRGALPTLITPQQVSFDWAREAKPGLVSAVERAATSQSLAEQIQQAHREHGLEAVISYCF